MIALIDAFHKELSDIRELADSTVENYTYSIVDYCDFAKTKLKIDPIYSKGRHILKWMAEVRKKGIGNSRLKNHRAALKTFFALLIKLKLIKKNPVDALPQVRKTLSQRSKAYVRTLVLPQSVSFFPFARWRQNSKAYLRHRSTPLRVLMDS